MAAARDHGQRVVCATATAGERGTDDPVRWPPDRLGDVRRWEAAAAMAVLGVTEHHVGGLPDGALDDHDPEGTAWVGSLLDAVRPDTILTFGADGMTFHPDHIAVHRWVRDTWRARGCPGRLLLAVATSEHLARLGDRYFELGLSMTGESPAGTPREDLALHTRLTGRALDRKLAALRAMTTQTGDLIAAAGLDTYRVLIDEEAFVDALVTVPIG